MKIGVVGIGNMGLAMAQRLRDGGFVVVVRDIDAARGVMAQGCEIAASAAELARGCALVLLAVVDAAQTEAVLFGVDGLVHGLDQGSARCVSLCPTISPADTERFAERLAEHGLKTIDAPMSGGPARARNGTMSLMVACADEVFDEWHTVLEVLSDKIFRIGQRAGDGARTKLVNNLLAAINLAGAAEAMALAQKLGLNAATTLRVIEQSSGQSWIGSDRLQRALAGNVAPQAHISLLAKDSALAMGLSAGFAMPLGAAAAKCFADAVNAGHAAEDDSRLWPWLAGRL